MSELIHQPCPFVGCGSSDAFDYNEDKKVGMCRSCGQSYPHKRMKLTDWARERYPLADTTKQQEPDDYVATPLSGSMREDYQAHRGVNPQTMRFFRCLTQFDSTDTGVSHKYVYPDGGSKTRVFPKNFHVSNFKSDQLFGMNLFNAGMSKAVTITEGELDAMSAYQMLGSKYPVVSLPSATPSKKLLENCKDWLGSFEKIYLSLDADDKAEAFAMQLMRLFPGRVYKVPHDKFKDANEFLLAGEAVSYTRAWYNAGLFTPANIYATEDDFLALLNETQDSSYIPTGIKALDEKILGLMQGHFTVIKAPTGIGKSELMRYLEYNFIKNYPEVKFASWHLEETKLRSLLGVVSYVLNDNVTRKDLIETKGRVEDVKDAIKTITAHSSYIQFHLKESDSSEELLDQIRVLSQVYGCQYIMFEPIQDIVSVGDDKDKEAVLATLAVQLSKMAADLNIGIVTIAHTNENGDPKYCKMIGQRASVVIDLERDKDSDDLVERNTTKIYVKKNRPCGLEGKAGELIFNIDTFTLKEKGEGW
jgi:twinkle protein